VESDLSSDEGSGADNEVDETFESSEEENEQALPGKSRKVCSTLTPRLTDSLYPFNRGYALLAM